MKASFFYRPYHGQTEDLYAGPWIKSKSVAPGNNGNFKVTITGLKKGQRYEYKAVVEYNRIEISGDEKVWMQ